MESIFIDNRLKLSTMKANYLGSTQNKVNRAVREFFVSEIRKEFKDDFNLISEKLERLINTHTIKDIREILRHELREIKSNR